MDDIKDSAEYKEIQKQLEDQKTKFTDQEKYLQTLKKSVDDIKGDRESLKKQLKELSEKKTTDNASVEELKKMLEAQTAKVEEAEKNNKFLNKKTKLLDLARSKNFATTADGILDEKTLLSHIDLTKYEVAEDGTLIGGAMAMDSLKEKSPHLFMKKKKALDPKEIAPRTHKGQDVSREAFTKAKTLQERTAILKARAELSKEEDSNMMPGMGKAIV